MATNTGEWAQEDYYTPSRVARTRARQLRTAGYQVRVGSLGNQVTNLGIMPVTLVTILPGDNADTFGLPALTEEMRSNLI